MTNGSGTGTLAVNVSSGGLTTFSVANTYTGGTTVGGGERLGSTAPHKTMQPATSSGP